MSAESAKSAESNPAVARCLEAWNAAYHTALNDEQEDDDASDAAALAYREALPPLFGVRNIRNYIACVAHGAVIGAIDRADSSRLIYAAQVAFSTRRIRAPRQKNARSSSKKNPSGAISEPVRATQEPLSPSVPAA